LAKAADVHPVYTPEMMTLRNYREMDFDLVHSLCGYIHPDMEAFPNVLTVHDLQHVHMPDFFSAEDWKFRDELYRRSVERAKHIVCISEYTRLDLHRSFGVPLDKMTTIWNIPARHAWDRLDEERSRRVLSGLGISGRFAFFPAHCWPHKNHRRLVEAFARIADEIPKDFRLYFTGGAFPADHPARRFIEEHGLGDRIVHLGYRSPMEMKALMQKASMMVFPSLFEGFGMPIAEAIIAGCPIACSNTTSIPEIAGTAARYFDPLDVSSIATALLDVIRNIALRDALAEESRRRRLLFRARDVAARTVAVYRRVHTEHFF
jgi:glycosyltransferase involved in cell wall biosynthesis